MPQKKWLNFVKSFVNSSYWRKLLAQYVLLPVTTLYFCHIEAKNVHHFVSSVCKVGNYLPKLLRFMLLITSYLLHYLPNLRININSLIYGKNVKCLTKNRLSFSRFPFDAIDSFYLQYLFFLTELVF